MTPLKIKRIYYTAVIEAIDREEKRNSKGDKK
jgi:hypothetical protein